MARGENALGLHIRRGPEEHQVARDTEILRIDPEGVGPAARLIEMFDPANVGQAFHDHGWNSTEAIEVLTEIARDAANNTARERMAAGLTESRYGP